jgi:hypothetical protein
MMARETDETFFQRLLAANELGIRLEIVGGLPMWEASPVRRHQRAIDRIRASLRPAPQPGGCECVHLADVYIVFPDGSYKRPDISIFCREPDEDDEAITLLVLHLTPTSSARHVSPVDLTLGCGCLCRV